MASTKPNHLPKAPSPNTITLGVGLQHVGLGPALHPQLPLVGRLHGCWRRQCERQETMWEAAHKVTIPVFKHKSEQTRPSSAKSHLSSRPAFLISWSGVWRVGEEDQVRTPPAQSRPCSFPPRDSCWAGRHPSRLCCHQNYTPQSSSSAQLDASLSLILQEAHRLTLQHGKYIGTGFGRTPRPASPTQQCRNGLEM